MNTAAITIPFIREYALERRVRFSLIVLIAVCVLGYAYFVTSAVFNVIARKEATAHVAALQADIATLEEEYFALSENITPEYAATLGYVSPSQKHFTERHVQYAVHAVANEL